MTSGLLELVQNCVKNGSERLNVAFLARVQRAEGNRADLLPLKTQRDAEGELHPAALLGGVPVLRGVQLSQGDVCLCVVCDVPQAEALGQAPAPGLHRHELSNSVVIGVVDR